MPVAQTSVSTYHEIRDNGVTANEKKDILHVLSRSRRGLTRREISVLTNIDVSCVAGRCKEMMGTYVIEVGTRTCTVTGKIVGVLVAA